MTAAHQLSPLLLVASAESCSESGPMARLADVTVGCRARPGMGWRTTLAGTALSGVCREPPCGARPGSAVSCWASRPPCCRVCCRTLGSIWKHRGPCDGKAARRVADARGVQRRQAGVSPAE